MKKLLIILLILAIGFLIFFTKEEIVEKDFIYLDEGEVIRIIDKDDNLILEYSIEEFNEWTKENWDIFEEAPEIGGREVEPGNFWRFDKTASFSPDFKKLAFSVHDYAVASYITFVGIMDIESGEVDLVRDPANGEIDVLTWSPQGTHLAYTLATAKARGEYMSVDNVEILSKEFTLSKNDLMEAEDNFILFMPEIRDLEWTKEGEKIKFTSNDLDNGEVIWIVEKDGSNLQRRGDL